MSVSEQRNDENKENGGGSVAAFFAQVSQASNTTSGPPPPGLPAAILPRMDPLQSLYTDPAVISVDKQPQPTGPMPPLPVAAKAASDLESDLKPTKAKKAGHGKMYILSAFKARVNPFKNTWINKTFFIRHGLNKLCFHKALNFIILHFIAYCIGAFGKISSKQSTG